MKPIMHSSTERMLAPLIRSLPQSMLITGPNGVGLSTVGRYIADSYDVRPIIILPEKDEKVDLDKGIISIDIMRRLYNDTRTKVSGRQIILIDYAERMTQQAQNAFLKLLEEPNENVHFILISNSVSKLLPTILSRVEVLNVKPITNAQSNDLLDSLSETDNTKRAQLLFMANGLPAELTRLSVDKKYFDDMCLLVRDARDLIRATPYQKLLIAQKYKDDRAMVLKLLLVSAKILKQSIIANPQIDAINQIDKIMNTYEQVESNGNIRLCLARMVI